MANEILEAVEGDALATARVVRRAFFDLGISTVVGAAKAFINVNAESLMSRSVICISLQPSISRPAA